MTKLEMDALKKYVIGWVFGVNKEHIEAVLDEYLSSAEELAEYYLPDCRAVLDGKKFYQPLLNVQTYDKKQVDNEMYKMLLAEIEKLI